MRPIYWLQDAKIRVILKMLRRYLPNRKKAIWGALFAVVGFILYIHFALPDDIVRRDGVLAAFKARWGFNPPVWIASKTKYTFASKKTMQNPAPPYQCPRGGEYTHWSCAQLSTSATSMEELAFRTAIAPLCNEPNSKYHPILEASVPCIFYDAYRSIYDAGNWADEAYVTYVSGKPLSRDMNLTEILVHSVHVMSSRPIVVFCFDSLCDWSPTVFPQLVVINVQSSIDTRNQPFDYNKWLTIMLSRVRIGVELDADMILLTGADQIFDR
jgi:hypothetical protein